MPNTVADQYSSVIYVFMKDIIEQFNQLTGDRKYTIYGCFLFMKIALAVLLICWQWHPKLARSSPTRIFDVDNVFMEEELPTSPVKATETLEQSQRKGS
ncbi:hypothetical protein RB195_003594 [Necator americanus]|uniref:Uncharacterized protein n=1 Tax=Necator americanus TaxID=51031 RepID=A0ABR1DQT6_NECAM